MLGVAAAGAMAPGAAALAPGSGAANKAGGRAATFPLGRGPAAQAL